MGKHTSGASVRTAIYTRISKDRAGLSENTTVQEREARAYIEDKNWELAAVHSDNDISASKYSTKPRPGYEALVDDITHGRVEAVLVTEMSRLYRRLEELLELIKLAESTPLKRIETTDGNAYWLNTGEGIHAAIATINNAMLESRRMSDRIRRKKKAAAVAGKFHGGGRPYGYEADGMTIRESEATLIREVIGRVIGGEGMSDIVRDLNERGDLTAQGKQWRLANIWRAVHNKRLIGIREHNGVEYPAQWPAIYTEDEFNLVEAARAARRRSTYGKTRPGRSYVLTGITYCACGALMYGNAITKDGKKIRRYRCKDYDNMMIKVGCGKVFRSADVFETFIKDAIFYRLQSHDLAELLSSGDRPDVAPVMREYDKRKRKLDELVDDYASGLLDRGQFARAKETAESALEETRQELAKVQSQLTGLSIPPGKTLEQAWEERGVQWRHAFVKLLIEKIVVHPGHPGSRLYKGWRFNPDFIEVIWKA